MGVQGSVHDGYLEMIAVTMIAGNYYCLFGLFRQMFGKKIRNDYLAKSYRKQKDNKAENQKRTQTNYVGVEKLETAFVLRVSSRGIVREVVD